jgi:hypothetical protein
MANVIVARPAALTMLKGADTELPGDTTSVTMSTAPYDAAETASSMRRRRRASTRSVSRPASACQAARPTNSKDSAEYAKPTMG